MIEERRETFFLVIDYILGGLLLFTLIFYSLGISFFRNQGYLVVLSFAATATVFINAVKSIYERKITVDLLASIALFVSLIEGEWTGVLFINLMIIFARISLDYVKIKSHSAISSLMKAKPEKVKIIVHGVVKEIPIEQIKKNDRIIVELGESIPVDGTVDSGEASVNQAALTGESLPVFKKEGDKVLSFTNVVSGSLVVTAEKIGEETTFEKIIKLVEASQQNKAPIYTLISKFASWYIALSLVASVLIYLLTKNIPLVLSFLLVSCADDIAIATPVALMSATTHAAKHGAVIKGGDYLEALAHLKVMIFDKTGTLTKGKLKIEHIFSFDGVDSNMVLEKAAAVAYFSTHPISQTILGLAEEKNISRTNAKDFKEIEGKGMTATYNGEKIIIGKPALFKELKIIPNEQEEKIIEEEISKGHNTTLVAQDNVLIGLISLGDELRPNIGGTIQKLKEMGIKKIVMLTGDNEKVAKRTAEIVGIDDFHANLLPDQKVEYLKKYLNKNYKVAMVGDGVNDAPTLAMSDVGIAMGTIGSDAAIETADIAMMKDDLSELPNLINIGQATMKVIRQNLIMWGIINCVGFILVFTGVLNPSGAAAWNFITDFIPIINSLRLFR